MTAGAATVRVTSWLLNDVCFFCMLSRAPPRARWRALLSELSSSEEPPTWNIFRFGGGTGCLRAAMLWDWSLRESSQDDSPRANLAGCFLGGTNLAAGDERGLGMDSSEEDLGALWMVWQATMGDGAKPRTTVVWFSVDGSSGDDEASESSEETFVFLVALWRVWLATMGDGAKPRTTVVRLREDGSSGDEGASESSEGTSGLLEGDSVVVEPDRCRAGGGGETSLTAGSGTTTVAVKGAAISGWGAVRGSFSVTMDTTIFSRSSEVMWRSLPRLRLLAHKTNQQNQGRMS